jgi:hypothetical protein
MRFQFDDELVSQRVDPLQAFRGFERRQREEKVDQPMPSGQPTIYRPSMEAIPQAFLSPLETEVSPHDRSRWDESLDKHVCAEVHMVMAVDPLRGSPVDAAEFVELGCYEVVERPDKPRVKYNLGKAVPQQIPGDLLLVFKKSYGTASARKRRRKVEVEARVNSPLPS